MKTNYLVIYGNPAGSAWSSSDSQLQVSGGRGRLLSCHTQRVLYGGRVMKHKCKQQKATQS